MFLRSFTFGRMGRVLPIAAILSLSGHAYAENKPAVDSQAIAITKSDTKFSISVGAAVQYAPSPYDTTRRRSWTGAPTVNIENGNLSFSLANGLAYRFYNQNGLALKAGVRYGFEDGFRARDLRYEGLANRNPAIWAGISAELDLNYIELATRLEISKRGKHLDIEASKIFHSGQFAYGPYAGFDIYSRKHTEYYFGTQGDDSG